MSKKKPEKVWIFVCHRFVRLTDKSPKIARRRTGSSGWWRHGHVAWDIGFNEYSGVYASADKVEARAFALGFRTCQAMYAEMFKEADDAD